MARPLRIDVAGGCYHVFSRGNEKKDIYFSDQDYKRFLSFLEECCRRYDLIIYAYALMKNHYHLLLETKQPNLSRAIHYLNSSYTSYFNRARNRVGHLFQGRFKSILVDKENYLLVLSRYIHLNPVRDGFVARPQDYPWSSYQVYLGHKNIPWMATNFILSLFSEDIKRAQEKYGEFIEAEMQDKLTEDPFEDVVYRCVLGSKDFTAKVVSQLRATIKKSVDPEVVEFRAIRGKSADEILTTVYHYYRLNTSVNWSNNEDVFRWKRPNEPAQAAIYFLSQYTGLMLQEIAKLCGGGHFSRISQIKKRFEQKIKTDGLLFRRIAAIEERLSNVKG